MPFNRALWVIAIKSTLAILIAWAMLLSILWLSMETGVLLSGFKGIILWQAGWPHGSAAQWSKQQVLLIYLLPYFVLLFVMETLNWLHRYQRINGNFLFLITSWLHTFLLIQLLVMPLCDILHKTSLYYALSWLWIPYPVQIIAGVFLWIIFFLKILKPARIFASVLKYSIPGNIVPMGKSITRLLPGVWFAPVIILFVVFIIVTQGRLIYPYFTFFTSLVLLLLPNIWLIHKYYIVV